MSEAARLAAALGVAERTVHTFRDRGMPMPATGEDLAAWVVRAKAWRAANRMKPGPRPAAGTEAKMAAEVEYRKLRTQKLRLEVDVLKGALHSRAECEAQAVQRLSELRASFTQLPDRLARRLYQAPSPDAIKLIVEEELRRCFEVLVSGEGGANDVDSADAGDAKRAPVA